MPGSNLGRWMVSRRQIEPVSGSLRMVRTPVAKRLRPDDPEFVPKIQLTGALDVVSIKLTKSQ